MLTRTLSRTLVFLLLGSTGFLGQQSSPPAPLPVVREFPVILQQNVVAGKTPAGTKVKAKLAEGTLENGTVIPRNAVLSGEVVESVAKTATSPSRLVICMDSAEWKNGNAALKLYMTAWYYPSTTQSGDNLQYGPDQGAKGTWNGAGEYPTTNTKVYRPFPSADSQNDPAPPNTPASVSSSHRVSMKDVELEQFSDGGLALVSKRSNIKLDHYTTYVMSGIDLPATK